jgi:hypothetical protein
MHKKKKMEPKVFKFTYIENLPHIHDHIKIETKTNHKLEMNSTQTNYRLSTNNKLDDSYRSIKVEENELVEKEEVLVFGMQKKDKDLSKLYKRMEDLHNLELRYFKESDNNLVNNNEFNEIYYNFKKKYMNDKNHLTARKKTSEGKIKFKPVFHKKVNSDMNLKKSQEINKVLIQENKKLKEKFFKELFQSELPLSNKVELKESDKLINTYKMSRQNLRSTSSNGFSTRFSSPFAKNQNNEKNLLDMTPGERIQNAKINMIFENTRNNIKTSHKRGSSSSSIFYIFNL